MDLPLDIQLHVSNGSTWLPFSPQERHHYRVVCNQHVITIHQDDRQLFKFAVKDVTLVYFILLTIVPYRSNVHVSMMKFVPLFPLVVRSPLSQSW